MALCVDSLKTVHRLLCFLLAWGVAGLYAVCPVSWVQCTVSCVLCQLHKSGYSFLHGWQPTGTWMTEYERDHWPKLLFFYFLNSYACTSYIFFCPEYQSLRWRQVPWKRSKIHMGCYPMWGPDRRQTLWVITERLWVWSHDCQISEVAMNPSLEAKGNC